MDSLLKRNSRLLQLLKDARPLRRRALLATLTASEVRDLCEIVLNAISPQGACPLDGAQAARCRRHKTVLRTLAFRKRGGWREKRRLIQRGGGAWLVPVLSSLLSTVAGLFV